MNKYVMNDGLLYGIFNLFKVSFPLLYKLANWFVK